MESGIYVNLYIEFPIGSFVYVKTDTDQIKRQVVSYRVYECALIAYEVVGEGMVNEHWSFELSEEKDVIMTSTN